MRVDQCINFIDWLNAAGRLAYAIARNRGLDLERREEVVAAVFASLTSESQGFSGPGRNPEYWRQLPDNRWVALKVHVVLVTRRTISDGYRFRRGTQLSTSIAAGQEEHRFERPRGWKYCWENCRPESGRTYLEDFYFRELSIQAIARVHGRTSGHVKGAMARARADLALCLSRPDLHRRDA